MKEYDELREFIEIYQLKYQVLWDAEDIPGEASDQQSSWLNDYALRPTRFTQKDIESLNKCLSGSVVPRSYEQLLLRCAFTTIDLPAVMPPWISFFSTADVQSLIALNGDLGLHNILAFAFDTNESGKYCFDLRTRAYPDEPPIVFWTHGQTSPDEAIVGPLVSSFPKLLAVICEMIRIGVFIVADDEGSQDKIERIRKIEPTYFGGAAWERWWSTRILSNVRKNMRYDGA